MYKDLDQIKRVPIVDILDDLGYEGFGHGPNLMYRAPWREDENPSVSVSITENLWHDFGLGCGGSNLDLVMQLGLAKTLDEAADWITAHYKVDQRQTPRKKTFKSYPGAPRRVGVKITRALHLTSPVLIKYAAARGIPKHILIRYCKEVVGCYTRRPDQTFYAIGFENRSGGWSYRNAVKKQSAAPSDISIVPGDIHTRCCVFEGFFDFLSYATIVTCPLDAIVLNSVTNKGKALEVLRAYDKVNLFLDDDRAGDDATSFFIEALPGKAVDKRGLLKGHKDLNDYLVANPRKEKD